MKCGTMRMLTNERLPMMPEVWNGLLAVQEAALLESGAAAGGLPGEYKEKYSPLMSIVYDFSGRNG